MSICTKEDSRHTLKQAKKCVSNLFEEVKLDCENLICVAGRPGMGTTSLALHMVLEYVRKNIKSVCIFTLDLSAEQLYDRLLIALSGVDFYTFREKLFSESEERKINDAKEQLSQMKLIIDDTPYHSVQQIEDKIKRVSDVGLVVIDNFQQLLDEQKMRKCKEEGYEIGRQLKNLAECRHIPIIITSKLSRRLERRINKKPRQSDLRGTGVSADNADTVCLVYRRGYYSPFTTEDEAEIIISKNKYGIRRRIPLRWQSRIMSFSDEKLFEGDYRKRMKG